MEDDALDRLGRIPVLVRRLYEIVSELEGLFPSRRFTPDGHLVGSIGEVLAAAFYGLELLPGSSETHDAKSECGKLVQIKATQRSSVGLSAEPEHLIVLKLLSDGRTEEVYNGPGSGPWESSGRMQKNGHRPISVSRLRKIMMIVKKEDRLVRLDNSDD